MRLEFRAMNLLHLTIATVLLFSMLAPDAALATPRLFDTLERRSQRLSPFPKWLDMLERYEEEVTASMPCQRSKECRLRKWNQFLITLKDKDFLTQITQVNAFLNAEPYITDPVNWGLPDYWATPYEFHIKDGDCEDYSIAKYMSLKKLGVPEDDMRIVVLKDENLRIHHAVLAVYRGDDIFILDNQIKEVIKHTEIAHYNPIYSINESYWWRHR